MLSEITGQFETISLEALNERAPLLNREDRKFIFTINQLPEVLKDCLETYYLLNIDNTKIFNYRNWYYDTPGLLFYRQHHAGKANRCKIRKRLYVNSGLSFIEIKHKTNKDKTIKHRLKAVSIDAATHFIQQHAGYDAAVLTQSIEINYNRITLLHKTKPEKITFDINLAYNQNELQSRFDNLVIAEVKTERCDTSFFKSIMKKYGEREDSFSKYCVGLISINGQIKHNNFKQLYQKILKTNQHGIFLQP